MLVTCEDDDKVADIQKHKGKCVRLFFRTFEESFNHVI